MTGLRRAATSLLVFLGSATAPWSAQAQSGSSISGAVTDTGGVPLPGAKVELLDASGNPSATQTTNEVGTFLVHAPGPGR